MPAVDAPEVTEILRRAMVARICTVSRNGRPHLNPLYFVTHGELIRLGTVTKTLAVHNVRANPVATILFEVETEPKDRRVLRIEGRAEVRTDRSTVRSYLMADARKYMATPAGILNALRHLRCFPALRHYFNDPAGGGSCVIEVTPHHAELLSAP